MSKVIEELGHKISRLCKSDVTDLEEKIIRERCNAMGMNCDRNFIEIRADLAKISYQKQQELVRRKRGYCRHCLRNYASPCNVIPLTEGEKHKLYKMYEAEKCARAYATRIEHDLKEKEREEMRKSHDISHKGEDNIDKEATATAQTELSKERLAKARQEEEEFRQTIVHMYATYKVMYPKR